MVAASCGVARAVAVAPRSSSSAATASVGRAEQRLRLEPGQLQQPLLGGVARQEVVGGDDDVALELASWRPGRPPGREQVDTRGRRELPPLWNDELRSTAVSVSTTRCAAPYGRNATRWAPSSRTTSTWFRRRPWRGRPSSAPISGPDPPGSASITVSPGWKSKARTEPSRSCREMRSSFTSRGLSLRRRAVARRGSAVRPGRSRAAAGIGGRAVGCYATAPHPTSGRGVRGTTSERLARRGTALSGGSRPLSSVGRASPW